MLRSKRPDQYLYVILLLLYPLSFLSSCRSVGENRDNAEVKTFASDPLLCNKPKRVEFLPSSDASIGTNPFLDSAFKRIDLKLSASDIANAHSVTCDKDGKCRAVVKKDLELGQLPPVPLKAKLILDFVHDFDGKGQLCMRQVKIGGNFQAVCIKHFIKVGVEVGLDITEKMGENGKSIKPEFYCNANLECTLPFITIDIRITKDGLEFGKKMSMSGLNNSQFAKVASTASSKSKIDFKDLPKEIEALKEQAINKLDDHSMTDIAWENFAKRCDDNFGDMQ